MGHVVAFREIRHNTCNVLMLCDYVDEILYEQAEKLGFPPVLLVDWRPIEKFLILFILDNEVAEQVTKPSKQYSTSVPKHPAIQHLAPLVGARSLVTTDVSPSHGAAVLG